ncbi:MAG: ABC-type transport auxiliary lipoprotein family protein [Novosphingobium sp.]
MIAPRFTVPLLALALSGCVNIGAKAPGSLLSLTADTAPAVGTGASGKLSDALVVLEPEADAGVAVLRVPVQIDDAQIAYVKGTQWVERPSRQFQHLLAETLRTRGQRLVVEGGIKRADDAGTGSGLRIGGRLLMMGFDARTRAAVVRFDGLKLSGGGKIETRRFEARVPGVQPDGDSLGPALNEAANKVAGEVADWVG